MPSCQTKRSFSSYYLSFFFYLYPIMKVSLYFIHVFGYCLSQQKRKKKKSKVSFVYRSQKTCQCTLSWHFTSDCCRSSNIWRTLSFCMWLSVQTGFRSYSYKVGTVGTQISIEKNLTVVFFFSIQVHTNVNEYLSRVYNEEKLWHTQYNVQYW